MEMELNAKVGNSASSQAPAADQRTGAPPHIAPVSHPAASRPFPIARSDREFIWREPKTASAQLIISTFDM
ncbi:Protein of unknown function [Gryllus bimaculatus]|nr:Protein of unknown function [Gryllus bimaculatus]